MWSKKEHVVARSSAEIEFRAIVRGMCELLMLQLLLLIQIDDQAIAKKKCEMESPGHGRRLWARPGSNRQGRRRGLDTGRPSVMTPSRSHLFLCCYFRLDTWISTTYTAAPSVFWCGAGEKKGSFWSPSPRRSTRKREPRWNTWPPRPWNRWG